MGRLAYLRVLVRCLPPWCLAALGLAAGLAISLLIDLARAIAGSI